MIQNTPEIVRLDPDNLQRDLAGPALRDLLSRGYTCGPAFLWQEAADGPAKLCLLMMPPPPMIGATLVAEVEKPPKAQGQVAALVVGPAVLVSLFLFALLLPWLMR